MKKITLACRGDNKDITSELERIEEVNQYVKQLLEELERIEEVNQYVKQLLEERETFTKGELNNLLDWIENGYVPSIEVRDEIDKGIIKK